MALRCGARGPHRAPIQHAGTLLRHLRQRRGERDQRHSRNRCRIRVMGGGRCVRAAQPLFPGLRKGPVRSDTAAGCQ